jgi:hypothetical protein
VFEKPVQKALDRIETKKQIALCLKHLVCPECASDLTVTRELDENNNCWNVYTCTDREYLQKRKDGCSFKTKELLVPF